MIVGGGKLISEVGEVVVAGLRNINGVDFQKAAKNQG